ncbi:MAG: translation initiation factor IF-2 N-terminal domain-containing protein, partial [Gemmataceae bacterium]|nr:translation initiation factor IF-2 N-terminal domain-containing protein [Gemmataceae bacterium]
MQKEKVRVYALAKELNLESKDLLDLCREAGFEVKNQLSSLDPEQRDVIVAMVKRGKKPAAPSVPQAPVNPAAIDLSKRVRVLDARPRRVEPAEPARPVPPA